MAWFSTFIDVPAAKVSGLINGPAGATMTVRIAERGICRPSIAKI